MQCYYTFSVILQLRPIFLLPIFLTLLPFVHAQADHQQLDRDFQTAVSEYESGHLAQAAARLEKLAPDAPDSFDVHELLGMVYAAQSQDAKATVHLQKAAQLNPKSAPAHTNLATNLVRLGKLGPAEVEFKKALELEPHSYDAVHNLGEFYVAARKLPDAVPYLEQAQQIKLSAYDNGYDLSLAYLQLGRTADARRQVKELLKQKDTAELHNLLGQIEEKSGDPVAAATEFQAAAHLDPSESNLFDWGSELLLHRTLDPAVEIFQKATERYPNSPRLAIGLGMALYSRGNYDEAVKSLVRATDLDPSDTRAYLFLSKAYDSSPNQAEEVIQRFRRFTELQPENSRALYYYAISLWKGRRVENTALDLSQIEGLLKKAVALDPGYADAHQQLGNLYSDEKKYAEAIPEYTQALQHNPDLGDAHYRLGQAYVRTGQKDRAQEQFEIYQKLREQHVAELERQRAEIRQFIYSEKDTASTKP